MNIYEFKCDKCRKTFEQFQEINADHAAECPRCGQPARRLYQATPHSFTFRAGWDEGLGEYVDTKKDRERIMREKGVDFYP